MMDRRAFLKQMAAGGTAVLLAACGLAEEETGETAVIPPPAAKHILIIGAGMAGLSAARRLKQAGHAPLILEARERIGGRIHSDHSWDGVTLDLGASWIHGAEGNPLTDLAAEFGVTTLTANYDDVVVYEANGRRLTPAEASQLDVDYGRLLRLIYRAQEDLTSDVPLQQVVDEAVAAGQFDEITANYLVNAWIEQEYGADSSWLSLRRFDQDAAFPGDDKIFPGGYDQLINGLAEGQDIRLEHVVEEIEYGERGVVIRTSQGTFRGDAALITVPLGVLQTGVITFTPPLPAEKTAAFANLGMGVLNKAFLRFPEPFWETAVDAIERIPVNKGEWGEFFNMTKFTGQPVLLGFNAAKHGYEVNNQSEDEIVAGMMAALRPLYGDGIPQPDAVRVTRWASDLYAFGAYSYAPVGATRADYEAVARAVPPLFFAGEATSGIYPATVHGAYLSGQRAAAEIIL
jgi:monoamine oxidase